MNSKEFNERFKKTSFRNISRCLRGLKRDHPYNADVLDTTIKIIDFLAEKQAAGETPHFRADNSKKKPKAPYLTVANRNIPLLVNKNNLGNIIKNPENGFYFDSMNFQRVKYCVSRKKEFMVIYDSRCGILELDFDCVPDFIDEMLEIEGMYVTKDD